MPPNQYLKKEGINMAGSYVLCEWDSIKEQFPEWQKAFAELETRVIAKCDRDWSPKKFGGLTPGAEEYGRTTIPPALFRGWAAAAPFPQMVHWRQRLTSSGELMLIRGMGGGDVIPRDFKVAWMGLMFPNKEQHITELRWQISDGKYGRINVEEMLSYNKPAVIFEDGFLLNEKGSFELWGYVEGPIPVDHEGRENIYQRIVMLGAAYFKTIDRVLGAPGAAITEE